MLKVVEELTRIYGANAFAREHSLKRYFREARFLLYGGGTEGPPKGATMSHIKTY